MVTPVRTQIEEFLARTDPVLEPGYSAVLYGSAARGDWHPGRSDINLLLVADALPAGSLGALGPALREIPEEWRTLPLLFTRAEWRRSVDVFPIEVADMLECHEVLRGPDPLAGVQPHPTQLRASLERELHTKLVRLRQGYALRTPDEQALGAFASATLGSVLVMARATLMLLGRPVPAGPAAVVRAFAEVTGAEAAPLIALAGHRQEAAWACDPTLFEAYLDSIAAAAAFIDHHQPGVF